MSVLGNSLLLGAEAAGPTAYQVSRSLRFNSADSAYCLRQPSSNGTSYTTWTWSMWVKRSVVSSGQVLFSSGTNTADYLIVNFDANDTLRFLTGENGATNQNFVNTTAVYRDASAWYHIVIQSDFGNATQADRVKIYVNGSRQAISGTIASQGYVGTTFNRSGIAHNIGRQGNGVSYFNGYLAEIHFIDGQALDPTSFTEVSATTGQLVPKAYTGTYGTNGFKLDFSNNAAATATALGADSSGNSNNWTPNNLSINTGGPTSVAAASGALPVLNTTDTYGGTVGTGVRNDTLASSLACAVPLGTASGLNITDQSPTGRVSAVKTVTNSSGTNNTTISQFYGGSLYINGVAGSRLYVDGFTSFASNYSTNFTIECWFYPVAVTNNGYITVFHNDRATVPGTFVVKWGSAGFSASGVTGDYAASANRWYHVAYVRSGTTNTLYINGVAALTGTGSATTAAAYAYLILGERISGDSFNFRGQAYYSDLRAYETAKYTSSFNPPSAIQNTTIARGYDSLVDTPTSYGTDTGAGGEVRGNYCTWNPLNIAGGALANGNLDLTNTAGGRKVGTVAVSSGKWYWEVTVTSAGDAMIGIMPPSNPPSTASGNFLGGAANEYGYYATNGQKYNNSSATAYGATFANGDVIGVALDMDAGTLVFYKNGTSQGTAFSGLSGTFAPGASAGGSSGASMTLNAGQRAFAYTPPANHKPLVDTYLPTPTVAKPSTVMDVKLWTGNGSARSITGLGFSPDLVWVKSRSDSTNHALYDAVRGAEKRLGPNQTDAEVSNDSGVTAFNNDGFSLGTLARVNTSSSTYVGWAWDAGSSTVTNTQGSITSSVRANASAGFSIVTYTGTGANATVGHGLGVAPSFIIVKNRSSTFNWIVYHIGLTSNAFYIMLDTTGAQNNNVSVWNNTSPTSTVFSLTGNAAVNNSGNSMVAYCFAPVAGYSSFGNYTGNGNASGPFVYLGFRPALVIVKMSSSTGNWTILDYKREGYNVDNDPLFPNLANAEGTTDLIDITSNGFKVRTTDATFNTNAGTYVYAAWAEYPFQYARAR